MNHLLFVISLFFLSKIHAQNIFPIPSSGKNLALADISAPIDDIYSLFGNQAGLHTVTQPGFILHAHNQFLLPELNFLAAGAAIPTNSGTFGLVVQHFGFDVYNEQKIGLAYSRALFKDFAIGAQIDLLNFNIQEYGNRGVLTAELGIQYQFNKEILIGAHTFNPVNVTLTPDDPIPSYLTLGITYMPSEKASLYAEIQNSNLHAATFRFSVDYQFIDLLSLRAGIQTFPVKNSFGIGLHLQSFIIDIGTSFHQVLGTTTGFSVIFMMNKKSTTK